MIKGTWGGQARFSRLGEGRAKEEREREAETKVVWRGEARRRRAQGAATGRRGRAKGQRVPIGQS